MSIARDSINDILSIDNKVDKIIGKSLSTEDYTTADKNKLFGIATNANNYSHPTAGELINSKYPDYKQLNIIRIGGADLGAMTAYIDGIRAISNEAERNGTKVEDVQWQS